ncbi:GNAT family N-acetyltransferase [Candidatus Endoriftia persephonae]|jgi:predicted N-acyltransferase|uniref:GNAT family N-acetyltransferase n=2 Tax=Gammaproteobacteria TaxID=1236 RepID=G2FHK1_9GAMM|nr:GNAT family N-acetyltransferase [Candidatus Endoriftia persephone]EGW53761.1 hypothetical protein TevJSym_av00470 [endosymbiont of Tevnia jerichonana (vent Tica)]USF86459.1 GNAT family N-acetyltransferase [Candidatus Endoriftia persephone]
MSLQIDSHASIDQIPVDAWNTLVEDNNPFLRHEFLAALEHHGCVGPEFGWQPAHLALWDGGCLIGAAPLYLKQNSYGEFVFDHAWADAYQRSGRRYFPKLLGAIPYTPTGGQRLLISAECDADMVRRRLADKLVELAERGGRSSVHLLFLQDADRKALDGLGWMERLGVQFHWHNRGYAEFEDFLASLTSKRRKNIRRERRLVQQAGLELELLHGDQVSESAWQRFAGFYAKTFEDRYSLPTLNAGFFAEVGRSLGRQVVLVQAYEMGECIAAALMFRSDSTLYGRHWGSIRDYDSLHFEACYYQGIDYCIQEGLQRFEPGAQGEHKIWRGFLPTLTYSRHWIVDPVFRAAIEDFLQRERITVLDYKRSLEQSSPYR